MPATIDALNRWSADWTALVVAVLWQSTLLALIVAAIARAVRDRSPALRYWLWQIVAIKLVVLPFSVLSLPLPLPWPARPVDAAQGSSVVAQQQVDVSAEAAPAEAATGSPSWLSLSAVGHNGRFDRLAWQSWLLLGWATFVGALCARLAVQRFRLSCLLRQTSPAGDELVAAVALAAQRLQLARPPAVRLTAVDCSPFVCRMFRPLLVLPRELPSTLDAPELEQVLLHELAHVKRRDLIWGWLSEIARVLYFFHPVAHWVNHCVRLERELACDQLALAASGRSPAQYAETLVRIVSSISRPGFLRISAVAGLDGSVPLEIDPLNVPASKSPGRQP